MNTGSAFYTGRHGLWGWSCLRSFCVLSFPNPGPTWDRDTAPLLTRSLNKLRGWAKAREASSKKAGQTVTPAVILRDKEYTDPLGVAATSPEMGTRNNPEDVSVSRFRDVHPSNWPQEGRGVGMARERGHPGVARGGSRGMERALQTPHLALALLPHPTQF